ncbi:MAG: polysaccharide deacetylase family protein [Methanobacterium sp.]|jgi:peptidoglycan/xylan/chitin deacetylase (PgdA/CDA1 family)
MRKSFLLSVAVLLVVSLIAALYPALPVEEPPVTLPPDAVTLPPDAVTLPPDARLVAIFFDDGWQNQYDVALPILLRHDFKASFTIITDYIGTGEGFWEYMSHKEIKELAEHGMDIAAHTKTHPDLTKLTDEQMREEIFGSKEYLANLGFEVRTFAYPFNAWNDIAVGYVKEAGFVCARAGWPKQAFDLEGAEPIERFRINSFCITNQTLDEFKEIVANAAPNRVVVLTYHHISDEGNEWSTEWSTPVRNFAEQMHYLEEAGFTVVLLPDLFE